MLHAVVMAGGSGTRFWPLSRKLFPKQFLSLFGSRSLLQQTCDRLDGLVPAERVWVITNERLVADTQNQLPHLPAEQIIGEPAARDTAPCIGLAAALLVRSDPDAVMAVLAADHLIQPVEAFQKALQAASEFLQTEPQGLISLGIRPTHPATGYGYLQQGASVGEVLGISFCALQAFHEKPQEERAKEYVAAGNFFWNAGIFCWKASTILEQLALHAPGVYQAVQKIADDWNSLQSEEIFQQQFSQAPKISIDYAVMEHAQRRFMLEAPFTWDDVGSWLALERVLAADESENVVLGRHVGINSRQCVVVAQGERLVATLGVENLIIVSTSDATLVARRDDEQSVKLLLDELTRRGWAEFL